MGTVILLGFQEPDLGAITLFLLLDSTDNMFS